MAEYTTLIQWEWLGPGGLSAWRGQASIDWPLHSSAHRRIISTSPRGWLLDTADVAESVLRDYEDKLLNSARMTGHGHAGGREHADLELLARLQHHGGATRLVDFSSSAIIALWFACRGHADTWGAVFGANLDAATELRTPDELRDGLATSRDDEDGTLFYWRPSALSPRIPAQAGLLVWSRAREGCAWGSLGGGRIDPRWTPSTSNLDPEFAAIAVSPDLSRAPTPMGRPARAQRVRRGPAEQSGSSRAA